MPSARTLTSNNTNSYRHYPASSVAAADERLAQASNAAGCGSRVPLGSEGVSLIRRPQPSLSTSSTSVKLTVNGVQAVASHSLLHRYFELASNEVCFALGKSELNVMAKLYLFYFPYTGDAETTAKLDSDPSAEYMGGFPIHFMWQGRLLTRGEGGTNGYTKIFPLVFSKREI